jgi:hypothetical protein
MKINRFAAAVAIAAAMCAGVAHARPLPEGGVTAQEVAEALQAKGYRAQLTKDSAGDPMIESGLDGSTFRVMFYTCKTGRCASIQFVWALDMDDGMELRKINQWNREKRFGRAYLDDENDPFLEMDVDLERGGTTEAIGNNLDTWASVLPAFKEFIQ